MSTRRRLLVALGICAALLVPGGYLVYQSHPDWFIAAHLFSFKKQPLRQAYEREVEGLQARADALRAAGKPEEEIARTLYEERRQIGAKYKNLTPEPIRRRIYDINAQRYGDPLGPSLESLVRKNTHDGVTDWRAISDGAARANPNVDRLLREF
jgi:hypothetical protein